MSASLGKRFGVVAAAISCLLAGTAAAQQTQAPDRDQASQARDASDPSNAGQTDRASAQQTERSTTQLDRSSATGERRTANYRGAVDPTAGASQEVQKFLAGCLLQQNKCEVELSQIAAERSQNPQVKQFAQQMVQDHQQFIQKLQPLAGLQASARGYGATGASTQTDRTTTSVELGTGDTDSIRGRTTNDASSLDPNANTIGATDDASQRAGQPSDPTRSSISSTGRTSIIDSDTSLTGQGQAASGSSAIHELAQIERQIGDRVKQAVLDELQQKQGAEFDKCYMGTAVGAHVHMNAALEVIGQQGEGQLAQLAKEAQPKVQQHLEHAKSLMKELEGQASSSRGTADRPTDRTQR